MELVRHVQQPEVFRFGGVIVASLLLHYIHPLLIEGFDIWITCSSCAEGSIPFECLWKVMATLRTCCGVTLLQNRQHYGNDPTVLLQPEAAD